MVWRNVARCLEHDATRGSCDIETGPMNAAGITWGGFLSTISTSLSSPLATFFSQTINCEESRIPLIGYRVSTTPNSCRGYVADFRECLIVITGMGTWAEIPNSDAIQKLNNRLSIRAIYTL